MAIYDSPVKFSFYEKYHLTIVQIKMLIHADAKDRIKHGTKIFISRKAKDK